MSNAMSRPFGCFKKKTVLLVGEGPCEWAFLKHLVGLFQTRSGAFAAHVENAHGGSPEIVLHSTKKLLRQREYDACVILMDTDRPWPSSLPKSIGKTRMVYAKAAPCLEGLLLQIVGHGGYSMHTPTDACKRLAYDTYVVEKHRTEPSAYARSFTQELLLKRRGTCPALDAILRELQ